MGRKKQRVAVIGGGPSGLFVAHQLELLGKRQPHVTIFEAMRRTGGKIITGHFDTAPILYEAGVAELYRNMVGIDPLWELVSSLGLKTLPMQGPAVAMDDKFVHGKKDLRALFGAKTARTVSDFFRRCEELRTPAEFSSWPGPQNNKNPLSKQHLDALFAELHDEAARRYLTVLAHSDLATEPHLTSALYGIDNLMIEDARYCQLYSIEGGIERLPQRLTSRLSADIRLSCPVVEVAQCKRGHGYLVTHARDGQRDAQQTERYDAVIAALPVYWLPMIRWRGERLHHAVMRHHGAYYRPAHYLRVSLLFRQPFWRSQMSDSYFQLDAFGGCCVYDEGARHDAGGLGSMSVLLAGGPALTLSNFPDGQLVDRVLSALPFAESESRAQLIESRVHRWVGTVNALPGGRPIRGRKERHYVSKKDHPGLLMVGDYLFDSTVNGALASAGVAAKLTARYLAGLHA